MPRGAGSDGAENACTFRGNVRGGRQARDVGRIDRRRLRIRRIAVCARRSRGIRAARADRDGCRRADGDGQAAGGRRGDGTCRSWRRPAPIWFALHALREVDGDGVADVRADLEGGVPLLPFSTLRAVEAGLLTRSG